MEKIFRDIADMIFDRGACKFGAFKLKLHEQFPDAPLSPIYFNLRTADNPKNPGPLTDADCDLIAEGMKQMIRREGIEDHKIAGIPYAADPIVNAYVRNLAAEGKDCRVIKLSKEESGGKRKIIPMPGFEYQSGEELILFDDLITKAHSKIEAIQALESKGLVVKILAVLLDREQGGKEQLAKAGHKLLACFTVTDLLTYYLETKCIGKNKYNECIEYIKNN